MRKILSASKPFIYELLHDFMMVVCIAAPIIMGFAFRFLIPVLESILCEYFSKVEVIAPYYIIFDMLLAIMTPIMFCFAGVLVMLEEFDNSIAKYYFVTPLGKSGYLTSRLFLPSMIAILYDIFLLFVFNSSGIDFLLTVIFSVCGGLMAVICALIVVAYAKNKIEGMAFIKLCGLLIVGIPVAYFVNSPVQYLFSVLPSFWLAKLSITSNYMFVLPTVAISLIIIWMLHNRFEHKLSKQG